MVEAVEGGSQVVEAVVGAVVEVEVVARIITAEEEEEEVEILVRRVPDTDPPNTMSTMDSESCQMVIRRTARNMARRIDNVTHRNNDAV